MKSEPALRFGADYHEELELDDGTKVTLRPIVPADKQLLLDGFAHLSAESRQRRFLGPKSTLSAAELSYLTDCDGHDHFAIGAVAHRTDGPHGIAVARIIRLPEQPDTAEAAITVVDEAQGHGLGRVLGDRLVSAARERGIHRFRVTLLADNERAHALLDELAPSDLLKPPVEHGAGTATFEVELPEPPAVPEPAWREAWRTVLALAAKFYALARG